MNWEKENKRRDYFNEKERHKIRGKVSERVELLILRCYMYGGLEKPLETVTDEEFLSISGLGRKTLAALRQVIPSPVTV